MKEYGLGDAFVATTEEVTPGAIHVHAQCMASQDACPTCGSKLKPWGSKPQLFVGLPREGKEVFIHVDTRRYRCTNKDGCEKTCLQPLPGMSAKRQMTEQLVRWIGEQGVIRTFTSLADDVGVVEGTIRNVFRDYIEAMEEVVKITTPKYLAMVPVRTLNKRRVALVNIQTATLVDLIETESEPMVADRLMRMQHPEDVRCVSIGFNQVHLDALSMSITGAVPFIDRRHVMQLCALGLKNARDAMRQSLSEHQRKSMHFDMKLLLALEGTLLQTDQEAMQAWFERFPALDEAYGVLQAFDRVYARSRGSMDLKQARELIASIIGGLSDDARPYFSGLGSAWDQWSRYIVNFFRYDARDASIDHLPDLARLGEAIDVYGRGYAFEAVRAKLFFPKVIPARPVASDGHSIARILSHLEQGGEDAAAINA